MSKAIRLYEYGAPDVLKWEDIEVASPGPSEVLVKHTAIGLNFSDVYARKGAMPAPLPGGIGMEAAGTITAVGSEVEGLKVGDKIAYFLPQLGAYAEERLIPASSALKIEGIVSDEVAAAVLSKGLTAHFLLTETYEVKQGDTILFHAASGGLGLLACQWAKHLGATVIGIVSTPAKATLAQENGCDHVLLASDDWVQGVKDITDGKGVDVVYDSVGKDTFMKSLQCLRPRGLMVSFGNASGPPPEFSAMELMKLGSLYLTRPGGAHYLSAPGAVAEGAKKLFRLIADSTLKIHIGQRYALKDAVQAHRDLESRKTIGASVLVP